VASRHDPIREGGNVAPSPRRRWEPKTVFDGNISPIRTARLVADGYHAVVVEPSPDAIDLFEWIPKWPVCLVFGHERDGVSSTIGPHADTVIRIPMLGQKRSLNVATAAGIVLYELLRHRLYAR
jgi:tRNA G18 (ribose-2'-O)-methylase SpoU